jgi:hypothetical protein
MVAQSHLNVPLSDSCERVCRATVGTRIPRRSIAISGGEDISLDLAFIIVQPVSYSTIHKWEFKEHRIFD